MIFADKNSLKDNISCLLAETKKALTELPLWERYFTLFWLFGPFFLLIERSPADAWLTIVALTFVVRALLKRDGTFLRAFWVRATFAFWGICLLSSALSPFPAYSLGEAIIWIRFPLFAMASLYWLARDKRLLHAMFISTAIGMMVMTGILTAEILIVGAQNGRLSWPYGDLVPGNYLAKVGMPAFLILAGLSLSKVKTFKFWAILATVFTLIISFLTGERINFILRLCSGILAGIVWKPDFRILAGLSFAAILVVLIFVFADIPADSRYTRHFFKQLPFHTESIYFKTMIGGFWAFQEAPIFGIGTGNYRLLCEEIAIDLPNIACNTHPHNYYVQLLGETGIIGLISGSVMIITIIWFCFVTGARKRSNILAATAFVVPFGLFFPIQTTADFFGQWNNIFLWSAVALALATRNVLSNDDNTS